MSDSSRETANELKRYLNPLQVWALSFGCAVGWGAFVMPGTTFLPMAGPLGTSLGLILGAVVMFIIGINYHFLMNRYQDAGGTLTYTVKNLGYDHGFMSAWFLILVYVAIIWANASALALISKNLFGSTFQFGFYYQILGYDVYFGEILLSIAAVLVCGTICINAKRLAVWIQVVLALAMVLGIAIIVVAVGLKSGDSHAVPVPAFATDQGSSFKQLFCIIALSPWAFVGFESISNSTAGFKFSTSKSLPIMTIALLTSVFSYVALSQIAITSLPEGVTRWEQYTRNLGSFSGLKGLPTFYGAYSAAGDYGVKILGIAAFAGILTGLIGNFIAASRLMYSMSANRMLPAWFGVLGKDYTPKNALLFLMCISVLIPFLGRTAIGWIVDVNTIGAVIAYAYTSASAFLVARREKNTKIQITGIAGFIMSILFLVYFMLLYSDGMSTESYLILATWSILGFLCFRAVFERDRDRRFGKSTIVWIGLLFLIFLTSLLWVKRATDQMTAEVVGEIRSYYEEHDPAQGPIDVYETELYIENLLNKTDRRITNNIIIQMSLNIISLIIMFFIYSIIAKRERDAVIETTKANERSRSKTVFLSNMSHDIRTPMNAIFGYIDLAESEAKTYEELKEYLGKIRGASSHLMALINDILEMSRIESGKMELEAIPVDLSSTMDDLRDLFSSQMKEKKIEYSVDASGIKNEYVYCDKTRLNRVLLNLVSNAYKFTPEGGRVAVSVIEKPAKEPGNALYEISVKDNGIGMSKEFTERVFDAFEREVDSTISGIQGTGLGLSIVKNIVEMMGGTIEVTSEKDKGSEFVVNLELPLQTQEDILKAKESSAGNTEIMDFTGKIALLVDDMPINRKIAAKLLERNGFVVEQAENGQEAVEKVRESDPGYYDVVLMDIQMPLLNGYEATMAIRSLSDPLQSSIPVIAMTANAFYEDIKKAQEAGMDGHIAKPIDVKKMLLELSRILS
ncbi:amino acid permease [Butyrivibrio sp. CB08]|uniref:ATP-binding response regulator n=1 Tax=Butyrivibrio sp. CB08 TaxID=2364879 RepID=UPI000EAA6499|nr:amino acid permease [Butyrivibrio sp. CB08]RKM61051.1 amino acid permease [Butyrivibrio sp. CB08]